MSSARAEPRAEGQAGGRPGALARRLTLSYALAFALSSAVLLGLTVAVLVGVLRARDVGFARAQLRAHVGAYARGGPAALREAAAATRADDRGEELLVRLAEPDGRTLFLLPPEGWVPADLTALDRSAERLTGGPDSEPARSPLRLTRVPRPSGPGEDAETVDVFTHRLPGGRVVQVGVSSDERDDLMEGFPVVFVWLTVPLLLLSVVGGALMARRALRPVRRLVETFEAIIATGDVRQRAPAPAGDGAVGELFGLFNRMLDRIEALVETLRGTLDDVAHDLRTPVTALRGTAEVALMGPPDAEAYQDALGRVVEASDDVAALLDALMAVAEAGAGALPLRREPVPAAALVAAVADLYRLVAEDRGVALATAATTLAPAVVDRARVQQALANLVDNALKYTPAGGRVHVEARSDADGLRLVVRDTGVGIGPDDLPHVWDRLYRGDRSRSERGLGLGLSVVRAIVEAHGGRVHVESRLDAGTAVTLVVPSAGAAPAGTA